MKGLVFVELMDFIERHAGEEFLEDLLSDLELSSGGAYTAVGNYPHTEAVEMVLESGRRLDAAPPALMRTFGKELLRRFVELYPIFFRDVHSTRDFLRGIESHIHTEVRKLYPDANPPSFIVAETDQAFSLDYESHRPMASLALGLIEESIVYFNEPLTVRSEPAELTYETKARFFIEPA